MNLLRIAAIVIMCITVAACQSNSNESIRQNATMPKMQQSLKRANPVVYFEIPVMNMERAMKFYSTVFNAAFEKTTIDGNDMALFPIAEDGIGISGALAKGEIYKPTRDGTLVYFKTENIDSTLNLAEQNGGKKLYPKTSNGALGFVAEFEDSEGNRVALHQSAKQN
jgi:uncharacterized protein